MKRATVVLLIAVLGCLGTSCLTAGKEILFSQRETIALVSVVSNWDIKWKGEEPTNPRLVATTTRRTLRSDPDLTLISNAEELINTAEELIRDTMADSGGLINLAEKETVLLSRAYQDARLNKYQINREDVSPAGYRLIDYRDKNFSPALAAETGIQRSMFVEFKFTKAMYNGVGKSGNAGADVEMKILILDAQGKTLYIKTFSIGSISTIKVSDGMYSQSGLISLFESVIGDACYEFLYHLED